MQLKQAVLEAETEVLRAIVKHPTPFHSAHEGYAVLLEEVDELWNEVKAQTQSPEQMRKEAIHVAAMALRFLQDLL